MENRQIVIMGIGCSLFSDQGFGIRMVRALNERYRFADNVRLVDGGLLGVGMTGTLAQAGHLIVIDAMIRNGPPGEIYRLENQQILERLPARNFVHQVEFLEALAHCQVLDSPPHAVLLAIEPEDTRTLACGLTPLLRDRIHAMTDRVLAELDHLGVKYRTKESVLPCV